MLSHFLVYNLTIFTLKYNGDQQMWLSIKHILKLKSSTFVHEKLISWSGGFHWLGKYFIVRD